MALHSIPDGSPGGADGPPTLPTDNELINGPVSAPTRCQYGPHLIVQMPGCHWRLATRDQSEDRISCSRSHDGRHHPNESSHVELPIQAGDPTALGLPQETGGVA